MSNPYDTEMKHHDESIMNWENILPNFNPELET